MDTLDPKLVERCKMLIELVDRAIVFGEHHKNSKNRMIAIMQNIIDNNGIFVP